jgi:hypothetical protein
MNRLFDGDPLNLANIYHSVAVVRARLGAWSRNNSDSSELPRYPGYLLLGADRQRDMSRTVRIYDDLFLRDPSDART